MPGKLSRPGISIKRLSSLLIKSFHRRPFKNLSGKAQKKFKADAYLPYVRVWTFCSNAAREGISTAC
jgi:hypothetical protein